MEMNETQAPYAYFMDRVFGVGNKTADMLLTEYGSPKTAYMADQRELVKLLGEKKAASWENLKKTWDPDKEYHALKEKGIHFVAKTDPEYPGRLRTIPDPPFALYVKGNLPSDHRPAVAVVGARNCSFYGRYVAAEVGRALADAGVQVISGMALGVDGISQQAALEYGGDSYGVLGCGVDVCYPSCHRELYDRLLKQGGVISAYPPKTRAKPELFPPRNRIISGLADAVVVVEARQKSGTLITVDMALEQGREVYCVPGRITDELSYGCNRLIGQGAEMILSVQDLLEKVGTADRQNNQKPQSVKNSNLTGTEKEVWEILGLDPISIEQIHIQLAAHPKMAEITIQEVMEVLWELVLKGKAENVSGCYYIRKQ